MNQIVDLFGLMDHAADEFVEFRTCANVELFKRDITTIHRQRFEDKKNRNGYRPSVFDTQVDYPNQFDWYLLAHVEVSTGAVIPVDERKLILNLASVTPFEGLAAITSNDN